MTLRSHNATSSSTSPSRNSSPQNPKGSEGEMRKKGRDCSWEHCRDPSPLQAARREFQQQENATFHPRNATGISPDQQRPPAPPWWKLRAHNVIPQIFLKLLRPRSQLELFLGAERPDKSRAISVPHWGWRCWGWLCNVPRCAQQRQLLEGWHHRGVLPGGHLPQTPKGQSLQGPLLARGTTGTAASGSCFKDQVMPLKHQTHLQ